MFRFSGFIGNHCESDISFNFIWSDTKNNVIRTYFILILFKISDVHSLTRILVIWNHQTIPPPSIQAWPKTNKQLKVRNIEHTRNFNLKDMLGLPNSNLRTCLGYLTLTTGHAWAT